MVKRYGNEVDEIFKGSTSTSEVKVVKPGKENVEKREKAKHIYSQFSNYNGFLRVFWINVAFNVGLTFKYFYSSFFSVQALLSLLF